MSVQMIVSNSEQIDAKTHAGEKYCFKMQVDIILVMFGCYLPSRITAI